MWRASWIENPKFMCEKRFKPQPKHEDFIERDRAEEKKIEMQAKGFIACVTPTPMPKQKKMKAVAGSKA